MVGGVGAGPAPLSKESRAEALSTNPIPMTHFSANASVALTLSGILASMTLFGTAESLAVADSEKVIAATSATSNASVAVTESENVG